MYLIIAVFSNFTIKFFLIKIKINALNGMSEIIIAIIQNITKSNSEQLSEKTKQLTYEIIDEIKGKNKKN